MLRGSSRCFFQLVEVRRDSVKLRSLEGIRGQEVVLLYPIFDGYSTKRMTREGLRDPADGKIMKETPRDTAELHDSTGWLHV